jgi:hypothetical protein
MARAAGVPAGWTVLMSPRGGVRRFYGNSQELTTNHKNNEQGGAEWTKITRPKRT